MDPGALFWQRLGPSVLARAGPPVSSPASGRETSNTHCRYLVSWMDPSSKLYVVPSPAPSLVTCCSSLHSLERPRTWFIAVPWTADGPCHQHPALAHVQALWDCTPSARALWVLGSHSAPSLCALVGQPCSCSRRDAGPLHLLQKARFIFFIYFYIYLLGWNKELIFLPLFEQTHSPEQLLPYTAKALPFPREL